MYLHYIQVKLLIRHPMISALVLGSVCAGIGFAVIGCGDTNAERRRISQHTKDLAAEVKANPNSNGGQAAMKELIDILNGNWTFARVQACDVLDDLGPLAAPAVPDLIRAATSREPVVEQDAVRGLRSIGPKAAAAVDILINIIKSGISMPKGHGGLRALYAAEALGNIGEPALKAIPVLEQSSKSDDKFFAEESQKALDKLKPLAAK
jgi:hypothetical protein